MSFRDAGRQISLVWNLYNKKIDIFKSILPFKHGTSEDPSSYWWLPLSTAEWQKEEEGLQNHLSR